MTLLRSFILLVLLLLVAFISRAQDIETVTESDLAATVEKEPYPVIGIDFRDVFRNAAAFSFSTTSWFRRRGYDAVYTPVYLAGLPMQDLESGRQLWSSWGGLNRVMRSYSTDGLYPASYGYTDVGGGVAVEPFASNVYKGWNLSYASSNRSYRHRLMATYGSGMMKGGWAFATSFSTRWAKEGYVEGTFYDAFSYYLGIDKYFSWKTRLSLIAFGAERARGKQGPTYKEMVDIAGTSYYNPYWGYQDGEKRNGYVAHEHQPVVALAFEHKFQPQTVLKWSAGYQFGSNGSTAPDWLNARDPRPDYYRKLPSFIQDPATAAAVEQILRENKALRQLDWDYMYNVNRSPANRETVYNINGTSDSITGNLSRYIIEDRRYDAQRFLTAATFSRAFPKIFTLYSGASFAHEIKHNFKTVDDLLGGDFYLDINEYAERDFPEDPSRAQNDLNVPNRILYEGDTWGYDYNAVTSNATVWLLGLWNFNRLELFAGVDYRYTAFYRDGKMRNGQFPENSFGKSEIHQFHDYGFRGGVTWKITGRHFLVGRGAWLTRAPLFVNAYISPRTRDEVAPDLKSEKIRTFEGGYLMRAPKAKLTLTGYLTRFADQIETMSFYHDQERTFVNYTLTGIEKQHMGIEASGIVQLHPTFSISSALALGEYIYTSRPTATITQDNNAETLVTETVYARNFHTGGTPELAATSGLHYRSPKYWFVNLSFNYTGRNWVQFNPARRTIAATEDVDPASTLWREIIEQDKLDGEFSMNLFGGYSLKLDKYIKKLEKPVYLAIYLGVNNLTNNKNAVSTGFEQLRFDYQDKNPDRFPPKYYYAYGINYFLNIVLRFD